MDVKMTLSNYAEQPISTQTLLGILKEYSRPYDKIVNLVEQGYLLQIRKGLYITSSMISNKTPEPFLIANHLYGPSYISQDAALFHWGMIPEKVFEITSVTTKSSKRINAQNVFFNYTHLPSKYYSLGIQSLSITDKQIILIASPEKSICDKIITTAGVNLRSKKQAMEYLVEDLRIEKDSLRKLNLREIKSWIPLCPKKKSIQILIESIEQL